METSPILIDSSIIIDFFRKKVKSKSAFIRLLSNHDFNISANSAFEIEIGLKSAHQKQDYLILMENIDIIPVDTPCIRKAAVIYKLLKEKNTMIELADLLIAATPISNFLPLATLDKKHFKRIPNIELVEIT